MHLHGQTERDAELCAARQQTTTSGTLAVRTLVQCTPVERDSGALPQGTIELHTQGGVDGDIDPADRAAAS